MKSTLLLLTATVLVLAGCSSTPQQVNSGPVKARTFSFVSKTNPYPGYVDKRQAGHDLIQAAITKNLESRGLQKAPNGDLTIAYLVVLGDNSSTEMISDYFGYGRNVDEIHEKAQKAYTSSKNPNYFEAGTLLIDILDTQSFKLLKRGFVTRPPLRDISPDTRASHVQEAVDTILRDFRVEQ